MYIKETGLKLIQLVDNGFKTAGQCIGLVPVNFNIARLESLFPNSIFIQTDSRFITFANKSLFKNFLEENNYIFNSEDLTTSLLNIANPSYEKKELKWLILGKLFNYPEICIKEFIDNIDVSDRKYVNSEVIELSIFYRSEESRIQAKKFIDKLEKQCINSIPDDFTNIANNLYFFPEKTRFGSTLPRINEILNFYMPSVVIGHASFNANRLSTQVPNIVEYLIPEEINLKVNLGRNFKLIISPDIFKLVKNQKEIMYLDILARIDHIFYDGYFNTKKDLEKYILTKIEQNGIDIKKLSQLVDYYKEVVLPLIYKDS